MLTVALGDHDFASVVSDSAGVLPQAGKTAAPGFTAQRA